MTPYIRPKTNSLIKLFASRARAYLGSAGNEGGRAGKQGMI